MDCQQARDWLLQADNPRPESGPSAALAEHLAGCDACRTLSAELVQLEQAWRDLPVPAESESARQAFLNRLPGLAPTQPARPMQRSATLPARWLVAALLLVGIGIASWFMVSAPHAIAAPPVIDRLVEWNLNLTQAATLAERTQIYNTQQAGLKSAVQQSHLSGEEQELASLLLENGSWLIQNDDPISEAEHFSTVADRLVDQIQSAAQGKNPEAIRRYAQLQGKVARRGVSAKLDKAEEAGALNADRQRRLEKIILRDSRRMRKLAELLEREPELRGKDMQKALDMPTKSARHVGDLTFDLEIRNDQVKVNEPAAYLVKLANHGKNTLTRLQLVVTLPDEMELIDAKGPTTFHRDGQVLIFHPLASLPPRGEALITIAVQPLRAGVAQCRAELRFGHHGYRPVLREQRTNIVADVP